LSQNLTFQYRDCDGNLIQDQVVLADSGTPDFCAEEGSVTRQSGTFSWVLTTEATTCIEPTPTSTPPSTPAPVTPTPTSTNIDPYFYYIVENCITQNIISVRSTQNLSAGISVLYNGECYEIQGGGSPNTNDITAHYTDCVTCNDKINPTPTPTQVPVTPTPTPTPVPVTPTPTSSPSSSVPSETLGDGNTSTDACNDFNIGGTVRYLDGPFPFASVIYRSSDGTGTAPAGYYSDGGVWRYWTGSTFSTNGSCDTYGELV